MNTPNLIGRRAIYSEVLRLCIPFHLIMQFTKRASSPFSQAPGPPVEPGMCKHDGRAGL
jgi:hypothetical protein